MSGGQAKPTDPLKKTSKKFEKGVDKHHKVWYTKSVPREGTNKTRDATPQMAERVDTMTKMTNVKALDFVLTNCDVPADVKEKLTAMKASFEKKASTERKPTATQVENAGYKQAILSVLEDGKKRTISDLMKDVPALGELSNQRVSAIVRQLTLSNEVVRVEEKRKAYFTLPNG